MIVFSYFPCFQLCQKYKNNLYLSKTRPEKVGKEGGVVGGGYNLLAETGSCTRTKREYISGKKKNKQMLTFSVQKNKDSVVFPHDDIHIF